LHLPVNQTNSLIQLLEFVSQFSGLDDAIGALVLSYANYRNKSMKCLESSLFIHLSFRRQ